MTRISFYLLADSGPEARLRVACRLAEKAYLQGQGVYLHADGPAQAQRLDEQLWSFRDGAFVPHARYDEEYREPVVIGHEAAAQPPQTGVLINLAEAVPAFFGRFDRLLEIVSAGEEARGRARERFRFYRDRGYDLETHELAPRNR